MCEENTVVCEGCQQGKQTKIAYKQKTAKPYSERTIRAPLELVHMDIVGPSKVQTKGGKRWALVLVDDYTRYTWVYLMTTKGEAFERIKEFVTMCKQQFNMDCRVINQWSDDPQNVVKGFRSDNDGAFTSGEVQQFFKGLGIQHQLTSRKSSPDNGRVERANRNMVFHHTSCCMERHQMCLT